MFFIVRGYQFRGLNQAWREKEERGIPSRPGLFRGTVLFQRARGFQIPQVSQFYCCCLHSTSPNLKRLRLCLRRTCQSIQFTNVRLYYHQEYTLPTDANSAEGIMYGNFQPWKIPKGAQNRHLLRCLSGIWWAFSVYKQKSRVEARAWADVPLPCIQNWRRKSYVWWLLPRRPRPSSWFRCGIYSKRQETVPIFWIDHWNWLKNASIQPKGIGWIL